MQLCEGDSPRKYGAREAADVLGPKRRPNRVELLQPPLAQHEVLDERPAQQVRRHELTEEHEQRERRPQLIRPGPVAGERGDPLRERRPPGGGDPVGAPAARPASARAAYQARRGQPFELHVDLAAGDVPEDPDRRPHGLVQLPPRYAASGPMALLGRGGPKLQEAQDDSRRRVDLSHTRSIMTVQKGRTGWNKWRSHPRQAR